MHAKLRNEFTSNELWIRTSEVENSLHVPSPLPPPNPDICNFFKREFERHVTRWQKKISAWWTWVCCNITMHFFFVLILFIYLWLCWAFVSVRGLSLVAASGGHCSSRCAGLSLSWPLLLRSTGSRRAGSVVVAHGPSCPPACGIFPDQGSNLRLLHWQADSQPLRHQGSPESMLLNTTLN